MHWLIEALIWAALVVGGFVGWVLTYGAWNRKQKDSVDFILLFCGLFLLSFCGIYMYFRFFIDLNDAIKALK